MLRYLHDMCDGHGEDLVGHADDHEGDELLGPTDGDAEDEEYENPSQTFHRYEGVCELSSASKSEDARHGQEVAAGRRRGGRRRGHEAREGGGGLSCDDGHRPRVGQAGLVPVGCVS